MPRSSAIPRIRACIAAKVPSPCHRCNQRCVAPFDPHWRPCGTSHQRQPVIKMYNKVFRIFRNGAWGIPRLRFGGAGGKTSSNKRHSKSLTPSNRPAILPSYVQIEQYSTKIILVGYIQVFSLSSNATNRTRSGVVSWALWVAVVVMGFLLHGRRVSGCTVSGKEAYQQRPVYGINQQA